MGTKTKIRNPTTTLKEILKKVETKIKGVAKQAEVVATEAKSVVLCYVTKRVKDVTEKFIKPENNEIEEFFLQS